MAHPIDRAPAFRHSNAVFALGAPEDRATLKEDSAHLIRSASFFRD